MFDLEAVEGDDEELVFSLLAQAVKEAEALRYLLNQKRKLVRTLEKRWATTQRSPEPLMPTQTP